MFKKTVLQSLFLSLFACFPIGCVESNSTRIPAENMPTSSPTPIPSVYDQTLPLFAYDSSAPFDLQVISEREEDGVVIQDVLFLAANSGYTPGTAGKIPAYLVRPSQEGSYAGVLFVHGLGRGWGTKDQFLDEAVELAHQGVISLLPSGLFPWMIQHSGDAGEDTTNVIGQVIELRHALDFLMSQPGVDSGRIAYVGHDYGAMHGAVLSGIEDRIKAYVLMAGDSTYSDWSITYFKKPADEAAYRSLMAAVDPVTYLPHAAPARLYFQFGGQDGFVPDDSAERSFASASEPKQLDIYNTGHTLNEQAARDRVDWLVQELELLPIQ